MKIRYLAPILAISTLFSIPAQAETTLDSAQKLVENYYSAINAHNYKTAFDLWQKDDKGKNANGQNLKKFSHGFDKTKNVSVQILNIEPIDAGMGHVYTTVNVQITATDKKGKVKNFGGYYNLIALNNTFAPTDWKIMTAKLSEY